MTVLADDRWVGDHGIGRFAQELLSRIVHVSATTSGRPMAPLDPLRLALRLSVARDPDIFFSPGYNAPLTSRIPFVFTIHDLNHFDRSDNSSILKRAYYQHVMRPACHRAAFVFTVSGFSRDRIVDWAGISPSKVIVVGNGVDASFTPQGPVFDAGAPYFLCVSNRRPHKNEMRLVTAFGAAVIPDNCRLMMTGPPTLDLDTQIDACGLAGRVRFMGRVTDAELASLYRGAVATLFPSLYEGFGLPVIESMACGTPVLTSTVTALPELADGAALLVDPESIADIAAGIGTLWNDEALRRSLAVAGAARAAHFSWDEVAARARAAFDRIGTGSTAARKNRMIN